MQHVQVPFIDVGGEIDVDGLALANKWGAIRSQLDDPPLVNLECRPECRFLVRRKYVEMRDRALVLEDRLPHLKRVSALCHQQLGKVRIANRNRTGKGLVGIDIGGNVCEAMNSAPPKYGVSNAC